MLRSRHTLPLILIALVIGGASACVALLIDWIPVQASEQAERVDHLMWFVIWACIVMFTIVGTFLVYSAWRFRVRKGEDDEADGAPIHGNTTIEVVWTIIPAVLLAVVAVWAYIVLADNEATAEDAVTVNVTAEQFAWSYQYPGTVINTGDLRVPVGRQVILKMRSKDVIHDFYVKEFRVKQDVVPGITTTLKFDPTRTGTYQVICAELCGLGHGVMRSRVVVMEQADYNAWLQRATREAEALPPSAPPAEPAEGDETAPAEATSTAP
ncbi:MAG: cytochrome c oxidase subunit II [Thermoleophilia bacterium]